MNTLCIKYLARLNTLCNTVAAYITVLRTTEIRNVDATIEYTQKLITQLQEIQRALLYFKNTPSQRLIISPKPPGPPDRPA